jgi:hypothetical protein
VRYDAYSEGWKRVEAVRKALFDSAAKTADYADELGYGMLRAADALSLRAAPASRLAASPPDAVDYAFLKLLLGDAAPAFAATAGAKLSMLDLEAAQVAAKSGLETRTETWTPASRRQLVHEMLARPDLSTPLRAALEKVGASGGVSAASPPPPTPANKEMQSRTIRSAGFCGKSSDSRSPRSDGRARLATNPSPARSARSRRTPSECAGEARPTARRSRRS